MEDKREKYLVVMAGGHGSRMGTSTPKQFLPLSGRPVLQRTIEKFLSAEPSVKVVTVLPEECMPLWKNLCQSGNFICPQTLVQGGITRFHSVRNALEKIPDGVIVAIHDGVRPLVSGQLIRKMFSVMEGGCRALIPVIPVTDTLKALRKVSFPDGSSSLEAVDGVVLDRSVAYGAQTPQMFLSEDIKAAYKQPYDTVFTDDASVAERKKIPLTFIPGERYNLKITEPDDLVISEALWKN